MDVHERNASTVAIDVLTKVGLPGTFPQTQEKRMQDIGKVRDQSKHHLHQTSDQDGSSRNLTSQQSPLAPSVPVVFLKVRLPELPSLDPATLVGVAVANHSLNPNLMNPHRAPPFPYLVWVVESESCRLGTSDRWIANRSATPQPHRLESSS